MAMQRGLGSSLLSTALVLFAAASALAAPPPPKQSSDGPVRPAIRGAELLDPTQADFLEQRGGNVAGGPAIESTGFESTDGWIAGAELCGGTANGFCTTPPPFDDWCPLFGTNCCLDDPHPVNGWYRSSYDQHCAEPHIETAHPASGTQHLRFAPDPAGGNPSGCLGFGLSCRATAFTPYLATNPALFRYSIDFDVATPGWVQGYAALRYAAVDDLDPTASLVQVRFASDGVLDVANRHNYWVHTVPFDTSGAYAHVHVEVDPCVGSVAYWYNGVLVHAEESPDWADHIHRAVFQSDNYPGTFDVDNYVVTREPIVCGACGDGIRNTGEECDGTDSPCGVGRCIAPGQPGECTCTSICTEADPCVLQNGANGPYIAPCDRVNGCYFTYTAGTEIVTIDTCGSDFDTVIRYWGSETDVNDPGNHNDDCREPTGEFGLGSDPSASCYGNVFPPEGAYESCTCHDNPLPGDNDFRAWIASTGPVPPPLGANLFVHVGQTGSCGIPEEVLPAGTTFSYQGSLERSDGTPVDEVCDFRFGLWDAAENGVEVGNSPQTRTGVDVDRGSFSVQFDFGYRALDGTARWLAIEVQCPGDTDFKLLNPRVELTPVPHSVRAMEGVGPPDALEVDTTTGMVGIGTTTPTAKLHIHGRSGVDGIKFPDGTLQTTAAPAVVGDITQVRAGSGLSGGGLQGIVTLSINTGDITSSHLATDSVGTAEIIDASITSPDILNGTIAAIDLATDSVGADEIATGSVGSGEIADGTIITDDIALGGVKSSNILDGTIIAADLGTNSVGSDEIAAGAVGSSEITVDAVSKIHLASDPTSLNEVSGGAMQSTGTKIVIGTPAQLPQSTLDVEGSAAIGASYAGATAAPTNGLIVEGNVGMGTTTPSAKLHVQDGGLMVRDTVGQGIELAADTFVIRNEALENVYSFSNLADEHNFYTAGLNLIIESSGIGMGTFTPANTLDVEGAVAIGAAYSGNSTAPANGLIVQGNVGIGDPAPSVALDVVGDINYTGDITDVSDERLKENIAPVQDAMDKLRHLRGVYFNMKETPEQRNVGLIAQNVQEVLPEAVSVVDVQNGYLGVSYPSLVSLLVEAVKEVQANSDDADGVALAAIQGLYEILREKDCEIEELREQKDSQIKQLGSEISNLQSQLAELKGLVTSLAQDHYRDRQGAGSYNGGSE
jgi:hypothetical protein